MVVRFLMMAALVLMLGTSSSHAATPNNDDATDCSNPQTQVDMNACASIAYKKSDKILNDLYAEKMKFFENPETKAKFKNMQKVWLTFRDKSCEYVASPWEGGSGQPMIRLDCLKKLTDQRITDIKSYLSCTQDGCPR